MIKHLAGKILFHAQLLDPADILCKVSANQVKSKAAKTKEKIEVVQFTSKEDMIEFVKKIK
jgi:hypothetical protein